MILKVGLTGGIGSGKSTIAKIFEVLGVPVYYADVEAKRIMQHDPVVMDAIINLFGSEAYINGMLNRTYIASVVFKNKQKLNLLNGIVHPATIRHSNAWMQKQTTPYAMKEAALVFESGVHVYLDYVVGVSAPLPLRMERVAGRDNIPAEQVGQRIQNQMPEADKLSRCDFIIVNDEQQAVMPQVTALHRKLLGLAQQKLAAL